MCTYLGDKFPLLHVSLRNYVGKTCEATVQSYKVGVIILSLIVLVQTGLLVGALVKIVLLTKKGETFANCPTMSELCHNSNTGSEQKTREERLEMDVNVAYCTPKEIMALRTSKKQ